MLDAFTLELAAGESAALVGATGSGKSTVARLLLRFYDPQQGAVEIDGVDVRDIAVHDVRRAVGVVFEDTLLFHDTVAANIAFADPTADFQRIEAAARLAGAHDFVEELPDGYDTLIGERGYSLSGGQRQRIAIARAIVADPRILVLDDATSAVDPSKEHEIRDAMQTVMHGRTTIVIAHRPGTIAIADTVVLLDAGRVAAKGTHSELLATSQRYRDVLAAMDRVDLHGERRTAATSGSRRSREATECSAWAPRSATRSASNATRPAPCWGVRRRWPRRSAAPSWPHWCSSPFRHRQRSSAHCSFGTASTRGSATAMPAPSTSPSCSTSPSPSWPTSEGASSTCSSTVQARGSSASFASRVFDHIQRQSLAFFDRNKSGVLVSRMTADIESLAELVQWGVLQFVAAAILLTFSLVVLFVLSWQLTLVALMVLPIIIVASLKFQRDSNAAYLEVRERVGQNLSALQEGISGVRVIQAYAREPEQRRRFRTSNRALYDSHLHSVRVSTWYFGLVEFCGVLATALAIGAGGWLVHRGDLSVGTVVAVVLLLASLFEPVQQLSQLYNTVQSATASLHKLFTILDTEPAVDEHADAIALRRRAATSSSTVSRSPIPARPPRRSSTCRSASVPVSVWRSSVPPAPASRRWRS